MDLLVILVGFVLGFSVVWFIYNRRANQRPYIQAPLPITTHLILAGNVQQYRYYVQRHFNIPDKTRYISSIRDIQGYHENAQLHLIGTYYERDDYRDIVQYAEQTGIKMPTPPEKT